MKNYILLLLAFCSFYTLSCEAFGETLNEALSKISADGDKANQIAKALHVKYIVEGTIDKIEFDGNTVTKDDYILTLSVSAKEASSGRVVWSESLKKFANELYTKRSDKSVADVFTEIQVPDAAEYLSNRLSSELL